MASSSSDGAETAARIARDDGDGDDPVWTLRRPGASCYHDSRDCPRLTRTTRTLRQIPREHAQEALDRRPCLYCVLESHPSKQTDIEQSRGPLQQYGDLIAKDRAEREASADWPSK